jgi:hypothetical protein
MSAVAMMPSAAVVTAAGAVMMAPIGTTADAKDARASMGVSAVVRGVARMDVQSVPSDVTVSAADLARGFVDVNQPTALVIHSNSPNGYALEFMTLTPMMSSMVVYGLDTSLALGAEGGTVVQRWQSPHVVNLNLKFRFSLSPGLRPGNYPWPLHLAVRPLESV